MSTTFPPEDNLKYLGVLLDNTISWKPYVQKVKTQLSRVNLNIIQILPELKLVYNSLIYPNLNYSILN